MTLVKKRAVLSFLWPPHQHILQELCRREPGLLVIGHGRAVSEVEFTSFSYWYSRIPEEVTRVRTEAQRPTLASTFERACAGVLGDKSAELIPWDIVRDSLTLRAALDAVCEDNDIAIVLVSEDLTPIGRTVADWANRRGLPCVHVLHGIPLLSPYTVHSRPVSREFVVFGDRCVDAYEDARVDGVDFHVLGNPAWDVLAAIRSQRPAIAEQTRARYGVADGAKLIVFATTWDGSQTAFADPKVYRNTLIPVLRAYQRLLEANVNVELVVKDRLMADIEEEKKNFRELVDSLGMGASKIVHAYDSGLHFVAAADVLVAVNSNMIVEAMHLGVPAINLNNDSGLMMGPAFEEQTGVIEVDADTLPAALSLVLTQQGVAEAMTQRHLQRVTHYNVGAHDGGSTRRVVSLLQRLMVPKRGMPAWRRLEEPVAKKAVLRTGLIGMLTGKPERVLEIGCGRGESAALVRERFPNCWTMGIEREPAFAEQAKEQVHQVIVAAPEQIDLGAVGVVHQSIDAVLLVDLLARIVDPWRLLLHLRDFLKPEGEVILSVPNVRNLLTIGGLMSGSWSYGEEGIPEVRQLRFFARKDIAAMAEQTGYRVVQEEFVFDARLQPVFDAASSFPTEVNGDGFTLKNLDREELVELCSAEIYLRLRRSDG